LKVLKKNYPTTPYDRLRIRKVNVRKWNTTNNSA